MATQLDPWVREPEGWRRGPWLVRKSLGNVGNAAGWWEMCKTGGDGVLRVLDEGPTARGMMDHADLSDGFSFG